MKRLYPDISPPSPSLGIPGEGRGEGSAQFAVSLLILLALAIALPARPENIVDSTPGPTTHPVQLDPNVADEAISRIPTFGPIPSSTEAQRIASKLDTHIRQFLGDQPFLPFHCTLGISGHETHFDHPDQMFYSLAICLPLLPRETADRVKAFLQLQTSWPHELSGFDPALGSPRESHTVPVSLRTTRRKQATSAFGVYAFWAYCHYAREHAIARAHWPLIKDRTRPLLENDYPFDPRNTKYANDEAQSLNGDIAGLIGLARLALLNNDPATHRAAASRLRQLLELRVNLDRTNPRLLEPTRQSSKRLHSVKLARYCDLVPELADVLRQHTAGLAARRLQSFREARNAWHLAFTERMIGGENYISPPHMSRALFAGAALIEHLDAEALFTFIDVPWCKGDFYFIEKCALALRRAS